MWYNAHRGEKMSKIKLIVFFLLYGCLYISVNLIHPVTTTYVSNLNLPDYYFGFFYSLMSLGQVIGAFTFGYLSDRIGRKWLIVGGLVGYGLFQLGFGFINEFPPLILFFRLFAGIFAGVPITLFVSMCLDMSDESKQIKMLSVLSSCAILGAAFGYEIGGSLYNYLGFSISQIFLFQFGFCLLTALIFALTMQDVRPKKRENPKQERRVFSFRDLNPLLFLLLFALLTLTIGQILINKYLDTYIIHIGYDPATLGHYTLLTGFIGALSNIALIPLIKKTRERNLPICLCSFIFFSAASTLITFALQVDILYLLFSSHLVYIVLKSLITPLEQKEIARYADSSNNGKIMGYRQTMLSSGNVIGPLIGSLVYTKGSPRVFLIAAMIIVFSLILYLTYFSLKKRVKGK